MHCHGVYLRNMNASKNVFELVINKIGILKMNLNHLATLYVGRA
jgi:hypothetical protein